MIALAFMGCGGSPLDVPKDAASARDAVTDASSADAVGHDAGRADTSSATEPNGTCVQGAYPHDGVCLCADATNSVCGDACVDLPNDDENCGACGHACPESSVCVAGQCGPTPVVLQPASPGTCKAIDLTLSDGALFWADQVAGKILRAPVTGGPPVTLAAGEDAPAAIVVSGGTAYWLAGAPIGEEVASMLRAAPIAGGAATTIVAPADGLGGFTVSPDGQTIYFSTATTISKVAASTSGAVPVVVAQIGDIFPRGVAVDGDHVVFATAFNGHIESARLVDGVEARCGFLDASGNSTDIMCAYIGKQVAGRLIVVTSAGRAFWPDGAGIRVNDVAATGTSFQTIAARFGVSDISAIAVVEQTVFYADLGFPPNHGTIGEVMLPLGDLTLVSDGVPIRLARDQHGPQSVAVDATRVYWSTSDCAILAHDR